jgi:hypothetical protein
MTRRRGVQAILATSAAAGLVGAHLIAYLVALPDAAVRSGMLRATGHGYFSAAIVVATVAGIFGVLAAAAVGFRAGETGEHLTLRWRDAALRIAAVQTAAFVVLEMAERAAANVPPLTISPRLLLTGFAVQIVLAAAAALLVTLIARVSAAAADLWLTRVPPVHGGTQRLVPLFDGRVLRPVLTGALHARAPPLAAH